MKVKLSSDAEPTSSAGQFWQTLRLFSQQDNLVGRLVGRGAFLWGGAVVLGMIALTRTVFPVVVAAIFLIPLGLGALYVGAAIYWRRQFDAVMDMPTVFASSRYLHRGDEVEVDYSQHFKKDTTIASLKVQLVLREWVRYTQGTNTYTDTRNIVMDEDWVDAVPVNPAHDYSHTFRLRVPDDAIHTWDEASDNKLTWHITVDLDMPGWVDFKDTYDVSVGTEATTS